jgi:hypothetical protein
LFYGIECQLFYAWKFLIVSSLSGVLGLTLAYIVFFSTNYFLNVVRLLSALVCLGAVLSFCLLNFIIFYLGSYKSFPSVEI